MHTLSNVELEVPLAVVLLIAIAHSEYDSTAPVRGIGREYIGNGITVGSNHYSVTQEQVETDGGPVGCVRLTIRPDFWTGDPKPPIDMLFPFPNLHNIAMFATVATPEVATP